MYAAKNHSEGPDKTVIGGTVTLESGATLNIETGATITGGRVTANQAANATAAATDLATAQALVNSLQTDFNALLIKLKAAGLMNADA